MINKLHKKICACYFYLILPCFHLFFFLFICYYSTCKFRCKNCKYYLSGLLSFILFLFGVRLRYDFIAKKIKESEICITEKGSENGRKIAVKQNKTDTIDEVMKKEILTKEELCIYLNVPMSTIIVLIKDDSFPRCYFGRYVRFSRKAVEQWVMDGGRKGKK